MMIADIPRNLTKRCTKLPKVCVCKKGIAKTLGSSSKSSNIQLVILVIVLLVLMVISVVFAFVVVRMVRRHLRQDRMPWIPEGRLENLVMFFLVSRTVPMRSSPSGTGSNKPPPPPKKPLKKNLSRSPQTSKVVPCGTDGKLCELANCVPAPGPSAHSEAVAEKKSGDRLDDNKETNDFKEEDKEPTGKKDAANLCGKSGCTPAVLGACTCD